jgi:hypothetical protein
MANGDQIVRMVIDVRVKEDGGIPPDFDQKKAGRELARHAATTILPNHSVRVLMDEEDPLGWVHVHVSNTRRNCDTCQQHAMDERE